MHGEHQFSELQGKTCMRVEQIEDDRIEFDCADGTKYTLMHNQECCEYVVIESIVGDLDDLVGAPILLAEEAQSNDDPPDVTHEDEFSPESQTWTFYKLRTIKGSVDIRWHGESNGYYSESVDFEKLP